MNDHFQFLKYGERCEAVGNAEGIGLGGARKNIREREREIMSNFSYVLKSVLLSGL